MSRRYPLGVAGLILALLSGAGPARAEPYLRRDGPPPLRFGSRPRFPRPPVPVPPPPAEFFPSEEPAVVEPSGPATTSAPASTVRPSALPVAAAPAPTPPAAVPSLDLSSQPAVSQAVPGASPLTTQVLIPFFTGSPSGNGGSGTPAAIVGPVSFVPPAASPGAVSRATYTVSPAHPTTP